jgi:iron complex outermembrane receptor protein
MLTANLGAEWQQGFASYSTLKNKNGEADSLQLYNEVTNRQAFLFSHVTFEFSNWSLEAGASINQYKINFQQFFPAPLPQQKRTFNNEIAPRFSVLHRLKRVTLYSSVSKGFSSPTTAEAVPTGSAVNLDLNAEHGINNDLGFRGTFFKSLYIDFNAFRFELKNTIVQRRDAGGGDYYTNAGATRQYGIEVFLQQPLFTNSTRIKSAIWTSYTWHQFRYHDFKQLANDFSGNELPGVAPHTVASGIDFSHGPLSAMISYYFSSRIPLNDANTDFANSYNLVSARLGYAVSLHTQLHTQFAAGVNNLFNQTYSLGNDINAFGGRYYNAAPGRNFYVSLAIGLKRKQETDKR